MTSASDPGRLADLAGIEPFFYDIWGHRYDIPPDTKVSLLGAFGLPAGSAAEIEASLSRLERAPWRRLLPPVVVLGEAEPVSVPVALPDSRQDFPLAWALVEENGTRHEGTVSPRTLTVEATTTIDGKGFSRRTMPLPVRPPLGYHTLTVIRGQETASCSLVRAPDRCLSPSEVVPGGRSWGLGVQLYGLRSAGNWGMGDFTDLARLGELAAARGAGMVGLNPLHALFPEDPGHYSPYSPSHRGFLDIFYIDPVAVPELAECAEARDLIGSPGFQRALAAARATDLVDYPAVAALKRPVLELLYKTFSQGHLKAPVSSARVKAFHKFLAEQGPALERFALFEALHEHFFSTDPNRWNWQDWPDAFRDPASPEVAAFAREHAERIAFFQYLQWLADEQLGAAATCAKTAGLPFGFYRDLAVGVNAGGAAAWADHSVFAPGAGVGAPPDHFNLHGQNWGLVPMSPHGLRDAAYRPFIEMVRANMRHAGVLRIDHVMALQHLYCIPPGKEIGAYMIYPLKDMVRLIALESRRNRCVVIGEDLGTVPDGFRPAMQSAGILSCRVMYFERSHDGNFLPPEAYPESALITATTHDLATLKGFWQGVDLRWRVQLGLYPTREMQEGEVGSRDHDRWRLLHALERAGVLPDSLHPRHGLPAWGDELMIAIYRFLAKSPSRLLMVQIEDVLSEAEQPNLPGTIDRHPNWRRRPALTLDRFDSATPLACLAKAISGEGR
ncbi:MAG: 4-alpha-glucanotransferase [Rhodospirillaceae bacterium]